MRPSSMAWVWSALLSCLAGCGEQRSTAQPQRPPAYTYERDIQPLLQQRCTGCHGANAPAGYALDSWRGLLGAGSDGVVRNAIPGDPESLLLTKLATDAEHAKLLDEAERERLRRWVVDDRMAYFRSTYHPPGWLDPGDRGSEQFHGGSLRNSRWNFGRCTGCHGSDLTGGRGGASCRSCHAQGPTGCDTCHGGNGRAAPPPALDWSLDPASRGVGAHRAHLSQTLFGEIGCGDCHKTPTRFDEGGHLFDDAATKASDLRAEVEHGARARLRDVQPAYDRADHSCSVYCHGAGLKPTSGPRKQPSWTAPGSVACGDCHSVPFRVGGPDCVNCHQQLLTRCTPDSAERECLQTAPGVGIRFRDRAFHGDGKSELGRRGAEGTCWACHGTRESNGAPGPDLRDRTDTAEVTVGLHALHLKDNGFRKAVPCSSCHRVPAHLEDEGHFDDDVPAEVVFDDLARGRLRGANVDLKPTWDRASATCSNVYCHDLDRGAATPWRWTERRAGGLGCGSCHGLPPQRTVTGAEHPDDPRCTRCHGSAYRNGALDPAVHINGKVDL